MLPAYQGNCVSDNLVNAVRSRYLDLLERSIQNAIYGESQLEMTWRSISSACAIHI